MIFFNLYVIIIITILNKANLVHNYS